MPGEFKIPIRAFSILPLLFLQLSNPLSTKPPLRFGTVPWTYTEGALRKHFPQMHEYMRPFNADRVEDGIAKVKRG